MFDNILILLKPYKDFLSNKFNFLDNIIELKQSKYLLKKNYD